MSLLLVERIVPPLWCGMVLSISCLEAPLKFRAPKVTRAIGLGIGKLVFTALNRVEIVLASSYALSMLYADLSSSSSSSSSITSGSWGAGAAIFPAAVRPWFMGAAAVLTVQTVWLIPALVRRADAWIRGDTPPESKQHLLYAVLEAVKIVCLLGMSIKAV